MIENIIKELSTPNVTPETQWIVDRINELHEDLKASGGTAGLIVDPATYVAIQRIFNEYYRICFKSYGGILDFGDILIPVKEMDLPEKTFNIIREKAVRIGPIYPDVRIHEEFGVDHMILTFSTTLRKLNEKDSKWYLKSLDSTFCIVPPPTVDRKDFYHEKLKQFIQGQFDTLYKANLIYKVDRLMFDEETLEPIWWLSHDQRPEIELLNKQ